MFVVPIRAGISAHLHQLAAVPLAAGKESEAEGMNVWYGNEVYTNLSSREGPVSVQYVKARWWPAWITIVLN